MLVFEDSIKENERNGAGVRIRCRVRKEMDGRDSATFLGWNCTRGVEIKVWGEREESQVSGNGHHLALRNNSINLSHPSCPVPICKNF